MRTTRKIYIAFGLAGGLAAAGLHAYLLWRLLAEDAPALDEIKLLSIGIGLGICGVVAALVGLLSRPASLVLLACVGALGLLPHPLTWLPAAALMFIAVALGVTSLRRPVAKPQADARPKQEPTPPVRPRAVPLLSADGMPLHWSIAAKYPRGLFYGRTEIEPDIPATSEQTPQTSPHLLTDVDRVSWGIHTKILVAVTVVALAALVIPFSLMADIPVAASTSAERVTSTDTSLPAVTTTVVAETQGQNTAAIAYSDTTRGLTITIPTDWAPVPPETLADYDADSEYLSGFAETTGPTLWGAHLNGLAIKVLAESAALELTPELAYQTAQRFVDTGTQSYDYFQVLTPVRESRVGSFDALLATARITWRDRVMVKSVIVFVAGERLYQIELQTDDADWAERQELFDDILDSVALAAGPTGD